MAFATSFMAMSGRVKCREIGNARNIHTTSVTPPEISRKTMLNAEFCSI